MCTYKETHFLFPSSPLLYRAQTETWPHERRLPFSLSTSPLLLVVSAPLALSLSRSRQGCSNTYLTHEPHHLKHNTQKCRRQQTGPCIELWLQGATRRRTPTDTTSKPCPLPSCPSTARPPLRLFMSFIVCCLSHAHLSYTSFTTHHLISSPFLARNTQVAAAASNRPSPRYRPRPPQPTSYPPCGSQAASWAVPSSSSPLL